MKERWNISKEKLVAAEEGLKSAEPVTGRGICSCDRLIQYAKLVLYVELILFLAWSSYTLWQAYDPQAEIRFLNVFRSNYGAFRDVESSTVPTEVLESWPLKDFKDTADKIEITENTPFEEDVFPTGISPTDDQLNVEKANKDVDDLETTIRNTQIKDSLESSKSNEDNEIIIKVPSLGASESNETESLEDSSVIEWGFPFLWSIHKESGPFTDDSSEADREFRLDDVLKHLYESNEKDESNDVSKFRQTSSEKEIEQRNEKDESNFSSEEVPSFAEIVNNLNKLYKSIEAARKDLHLEVLRDDDFLESLENSNKDEISDPPKSTNTYLFTWESNNFKEPSEESTLASIPLTNGSNEDKSDDFLPWTIFVSPSKPDESEEFDTSKVDETQSALNSYVWSREPSTWFGDSEEHSTVGFAEKNKNRETFTVVTNEEDNGSIMERGWRPFVGDTDPMLGIGNHRLLQTTTNPSTRFGDSEEYSTVGFAEKNKNRETSTVATNEEDNGSIMDRGWEPFYSSYDDFGAPLPTENVDSESSNASTNEEDNSAVMDNEWEPFFNFHDDSATSWLTENVDSETSNTTTNEEDNSSGTDSEWEPVPYWFRDVDKPSRDESVNSAEETIQFGPRTENEDFTDSVPCTIEFSNGIRVLKCSRSWAYSNHSSDSSDTTESKSDSTMEDHLAFFGENDGSFDISRKMHTQDNMELSDETSDIYDSSVIDKIEKESIKSTSSPEDSSVAAEISKFEILDTTASSTTKDSTVSPSEIDWHLPFEQTKTILDHEDASVDKLNGETLVQDWVRKPEIMKETNQRYANEDLDESMERLYSAVEEAIISANNGGLYDPYLRTGNLGDDYISQESICRLSKANVKN